MYVRTYVCTIGLAADCSSPADSSPHCLPLPLLPALPFQTYQVQLSPPCLNLLGLLQPGVTIERAVQVRTRACMRDALLTHWPWIRVTRCYACNVRMYVCTPDVPYIRMYVLNVCTYVCIVCMYICMYCIYVHIRICIVCTYVHMYVLYVCTYVCIVLYVHCM